MLTTNTSTRVNQKKLWNCRGPPYQRGPRHETQQPPHRYATEDLWRNYYV